MQWGDDWENSWLSRDARRSCHRKGDGIAHLNCVKKKLIFNLGSIYVVTVEMLKCELSSFMK